MAMRGQVVDLFPADAVAPVRIEIVDAVINAIRLYDPVSQLGTEAIESIQVGRVSEPALRDDWVTLFDHISNARIAVDPESEARRDRYVGLATNAAKARGIDTLPIVDRKRWDEALKGRTTIDIAHGDEQPVPRFVERKAPGRAFARFAKAALEQGDRLVLLGTTRDIRFLAPRLAKAQ
eukprot:gene44567-56428_t